MFSLLRVRTKGRIAVRLWSKTFIDLERTTDILNIYYADSSLPIYV